MKIQIFRNKIRKILEDYALQNYMWSEEHGKEPDVEYFVDKILKLIIKLAKYEDRQFKQNNT